VSCIPLAELAESNEAKLFCVSVTELIVIAVERTRVSVGIKHAKIRTNSLEFFNCSQLGTSSVIVQPITSNATMIIKDCFFNLKHIKLMKRRNKTNAMEWNCEETGSDINSSGKQKIQQIKDIQIFVKSINGSALIFKNFLD
jgi:hypothetical protein